MNNPIGVVSCHLEFETIEEAYDKLMAHGFDAVEWFERKDLYFCGEARADQIRRTSEALGIENSYHAFYYGEWDLGRQEADRAAHALRRQVESADRLGARLMTIHMGSFDPAVGRETALARVVEAVAKVAPIAHRRDVTIAVENFTVCHGDTALGERTEDFEVLFAKVASPAVGLNLDIGHAHITRNLDELLGRFGSRLRNIHLHDTDGATDGHLPPGGGTVDWDRLLAGLKAARYAGPIQFEFPETSGKFGECMGRIRSC